MTPAPKRVRCAIYTRKSTTQNLDSDFSSLDAQREACEHYIRAHVSEGWELTDGRYDDGGYTGANTDRPAFQHLIRDIQAKKIDLVVVYKVDRLSRSLLDFAKVMDSLHSEGVDFVAVTQNFSTANALGKLTLNILMSFAQFEREMISERTRDKVRAARKRGKWTGGRAPYGYDNVDRRLVVAAFESLVVAEMFTAYTEHKSIMAVVRELKRLGRTMQRSHGKNFECDHEPWDKKTVLRVLRNPVYAGLIEAEGELVPGQHEALIERGLFDRVQATLDARDGSGGPRRNPEFFLRGLLRCGRCGGLMTGASSRRARTEYRYYRCSTRDQEGSEVCPTRQISATALEQVVVERIRVEAMSPELLAESRRRFSERVEREQKHLTIERAEIPSLVARLRRELDKLLDEAAKGIPGVTERKLDQVAALERSIKDQQARLTRVIERLEALEGVADDTAWITKELGRFETLWDSMNADNRGRFVRCLVREVRYHEADGTVHTEFVDTDEAAALSLVEVPT